MHANNPVSLSRVLCRPKISEELRTLILRMLDKNPDNRITIPEIKVTWRTEQMSNETMGFDAASLLVIIIRISL